MYNTDIEPLRHTDVKLIIVADNPGQEEQTDKSYLSGNGKAGKRAQKIFDENHGLGIKFREEGTMKDVLVLNKTPIHTPTTEVLQKLKKIGDHSVEIALNDSQKKMADILLRFQKTLPTVPVWIVGTSELRGIFKTFTDTLEDLYAHEPKLLANVFLFRHFSRGWFEKDIKKIKEKLASETLTLTLLHDELGREKREMVFRKISL